MIPYRQTCAANHLSVLCHNRPSLNIKDGHYTKYSLDYSKISVSSRLLHCSLKKEIRVNHAIGSYEISGKRVWKFV